MWFSSGCSLCTSTSSGGDPWSCSTIFCWVGRKPLRWQNLFYCFLGVTLGNLLGVLPGVGSVAAVSILLPVTYHVPPTTGLIMLAGLYYGAVYGAVTGAILLNIPHTVSAVECLDGYPMARKGRAGVALFMTTMASLCGSLVGIVVLALFAPPLATVALTFRSPEYFALGGARDDGRGGAGAWVADQVLHLRHLRHADRPGGHRRYVRELRASRSG